MSLTKIKQEFEVDDFLTSQKIIQDFAGSDFLARILDSLPEPKDPRSLDFLVHQSHPFARKWKFFLAYLTDLKKSVICTPSTEVMDVFFLGQQLDQVLDLNGVDQNLKPLDGEWLKRKWKKGFQRAHSYPKVIYEVQIAYRILVKGCELSYI